MQMNLSNIEKKPNFWRTLSYLDSIAKKTILNETGDAMFVKSNENDESEY